MIRIKVLYTSYCLRFNSEVVALIGNFELIDKVEENNIFAFMSQYAVISGLIK